MIPDGLCGECLTPYWGGEHDHRSFGTLTPEAAHAWWVEKKEAEHASESR